MALGDTYITVDELRDEFDIGDTDDDLFLTAALTTASTWVTSYCERDFNQAAVVSARTFYHDGLVVRVDDIASTTGLVVKTGTADDGAFETTWTSTDYQLEPLNGVAAGVTGWPYTRIRFVEYPSRLVAGHRPSVEVTALWGWPAVPEPIKTATKIQGARIFKRKDSPEGVLGGFGDFGAVRVGTRLDPDVQLILDPYRKNPIGMA